MATRRHVLLLTFATLWDKWDESVLIWRENPGQKAAIALVETCLRALPEILTGKVQATEVLFPNASMDLVEGVYKHNPVADHFNDILAETVVTFFKKRRAKRSMCKHSNS